METSYETVTFEADSHIEASEQANNWLHHHKGEVKALSSNLVAFPASNSASKMKFIVFVLYRDL